MPKNRYSSESESDGPTKPKKQCTERKSEEYRQKRDRNNVAVRKSREKTRAQAKETIEKVNRLKRENQDLEMKVTLLSKELNLLKDLFLGHAGNGLNTEPDSANLVIQSDETITFMSSDVKSEDEDSEGDSLDGSMLDMYPYGGKAGIPANAEAVQKDHEYSAPAGIRVK